MYIILHRSTCLVTGIVMEIHCHIHITGIFYFRMSSSLFSAMFYDFTKYYSSSLPPQIPEICTQHG